MDDVRKRLKATQIIRIIIDSDIERFEKDFEIFLEYLIRNNHLINQLQNSFTNSYDHNIINDDYIDFIIEEKQKYFSNYPKLLYNSFLLTLYSHFENTLSILKENLIQYDSKNIRNKLKKSKNGESIIEFHKRFLTSNYDLDFNCIEELWDKILEYKNIRNAIVHANSNFNHLKTVCDFTEVCGKCDKCKLITSLKKFESIIVDYSTGDFYINNEKFLIDFIEAIKNCLIIIYQELKFKI